MSFLGAHALPPQGEEQVFKGVDYAELPAPGLHGIHQPRLHVGDEDIGLGPGLLLVDLEEE